jgi:hypothetical protein
MNKRIKQLLCMSLCLAAAATLQADMGRTELSQADFMSPPYRIYEPGSYVFTENVMISSADTSAIIIYTNNVTIDLNGFCLTGSGTNSDHGIAQWLLQHNATIKNGTLRNWRGSAKYALLLYGQNNRLEDLTVRNCTYGMGVGTEASVIRCAAIGNEVGIITSSGSVISDSTVSGNTFGGMITGSDSLVLNCSAHSNGFGIVASKQNMLSDCVVSGNASNGVETRAHCLVKSVMIDDQLGDGLLAQDGTAVRDCMAYSNTRDGLHVTTNCSVMRCTSVDNGQAGIYAAQRCLVQDCTSGDSNTDGIELYEPGGDCRIVGNALSSNDQSGVWARSGLGRNYIQDNHAAFNRRGFEFYSPSNMVVRNSAPTNHLADFAVFSSSGQIGPMISDPSNYYECANFQF